MLRGNLIRLNIHESLGGQRRWILMSNTQTDGKGIFEKIKETLEERNKKSQMDKYAQQLSIMSDREIFDLEAFGAQIDASQLSGWRTMIPGINNTAAMTGLKNTQKVLEATRQIIGPNATISQLRAMDKKDKLQIAIKSEQTPEDINSFLDMFSSLNIMHRILRYRKLHGLPIPTDEDTAKSIFAADVSKVLSPQEIRQMKKTRAQSMKIMRKH